MNEGPFPIITPPFRGDKVLLYNVLPKKSNDIEKPERMTVTLVSTREVADLRLDVQIDGLERDRARGYWRPTVRKHGFFNVTSFEQLNFDRFQMVPNPGPPLWYISPKMVNRSYFTAMIKSSVGMHQR
jgi:hypothetical protein